MKTIYKLAPLFLILLLLSSCKMNEIKIGEVSNVKYLGVHDNSVILIGDVFIDNPGIFKLKIKEIDAKISVNNLGMGKITKIDTIIVPPKTKQQHKVKMYLEVTNIAGGVLVLVQMFGKKRSVFDIKGEVKIKYFIFNRTIKFNRRSKSRSSKRPVPHIQ